MIVVVIIGVLAGISLPRIFGANEPAHAGDAVQALGLLHSAQSTLCLDNDCSTSYPIGPSGETCRTLEVSVSPNTSKFDPVICEANGDIWVTRKGDLYTIKVDKNGVFSCDDPTSAACKNIAKVIPK